MDPVWVEQRRRRLHLRPRRRRQRLELRHEVEEARAAHELQRLRRQGARRRVGRKRRRVRAGRRHPSARPEVRQGARRQHHRRGRLPVDDAAVEGRQREHEQPRALADGQARRGRSARRDLHDPGRQGRRSQSHELERSAPSTSRRGRPTARSLSYFSDRSGEYALYIEAQDGLTPPREIKIPTTGHFYTAAWSPDGKRIMFHDTNLKLWVVDVATGQAKIVGSDPWMVPTRTMNPAWSPDGKWIAYAKHLNSLYHAIEVVNVETGVVEAGDRRSRRRGVAGVGRERQVPLVPRVDRLRLKSQWLDMTNYDHTETFGLYAAMLRKTDPSPFLPESDEEGAAARRTWAAVGGGGRGGRGGAARRPTARGGGEAAPRPGAARAASHSHDRLRRTAASHPRRAGHSGAPVLESPAPALPGMVYFLEAAAGGGGGGRGGAGGGATLHRYSLRDHRDTPFVTGVADYDVSLDGHKLAVSRRGGGGGGRGGRGGAQPAGGGPALFLVDADRNPPQAGAGSHRRRSARVRRLRSRSSSRSSTRRGATSATTSTCRTSTAPTGRR